VYVGVLEAAWSSWKVLLMLSVKADGWGSVKPSNVEVTTVRS